MPYTTCSKMATRGLPLPMVAFVHKKAKQIEHSKDFSLKDEDIDRVSCLLYCI